MWFNLVLNHNIPRGSAPWVSNEDGFGKPLVFQKYNLA